MPKKNRKSKIKKRSPKKKRIKNKKKSSKKKKISQKRIKSKTKKNKLEKSSSQELILKTKPEWIKASLANKSQYQNKYNESIKNNNSFWKKEGKRITWIKPYKNYYCF